MDGTITIVLLTSNHVSLQLKWLLVKLNNPSWNIRHKTR